MSDPIEKQIKVQKMIMELDENLKNYPDSPFSETGFVKLREKINIFIIELIDESFQIAKRQQSDIISDAYVEQANNRLASNKKSKFSNIFGTLGGALSGLFLSVLYTMFSTNQFPQISVGIAIFSGVVGAILITLQFTLE